MGGHQSTPNDTTSPKISPPSPEDWVNALAVLLAVTLVYHVLRKCFRKMTGSTTITFAFHHKTNDGEEIRVVGNVEELGHWDCKRTAGKMKLNNKHRDDPVWVSRVDLKLPPAHQPLEYKYVLMKDNKFKEWEPCANRVLRDKSANDGGELILHQSWGGHDKACSTPFWGGNAMTQPLMGG